MPSWVALCLAAGLVLLIDAGKPSLAENALTGSEAVRAARCAGDYVCDDDGSWAIAQMCARQRAAPLAAAETERERAAPDHRRAAGETPRMADGR